MPYRSMAQMRFMHARHPGIARRWDRKYGSQEDLPERSGDTKAARRRAILGLGKRKKGK